MAQLPQPFIAAPNLLKFPVEAALPTGFEGCVHTPSVGYSGVNPPLDGTICRKLGSRLSWPSFYLFPFRLQSSPC